MPPPRLPKLSLPSDLRSRLRHQPDGTEAASQTASGEFELPANFVAAAGFAWRLLVIAGAVWLIWRIFSRLSEVTVPLGAGLLLTAALWPMRSWLASHRVPRWLAVLASMLALFGVVFGILALVSTQLAAQSSELGREALATYHAFTHWLVTGPLHLTQAQVDNAMNKITVWAKHSQSLYASWATTFGLQLGRFMTGLALTLFATFYFLYDGGRLSRLGFSLVPRRGRSRVETACRRGWLAVVTYVRAAVVVAAVDALGSTTGAFAIGSNMFLAIGALTFLCAFIPLVGGLISGTISTGVVLMTLGPLKAVIMLVVFVAVIEIEAHVMGPLLLGRAVSLHPLVVLFGLASGIIIAGVAGGLFTVPLMAFFNAASRAWMQDVREVQQLHTPAEVAAMPVGDVPTAVVASSPPDAAVGQSVPASEPPSSSPAVPVSESLPSEPDDRRSSESAGT